MASELSVEFDEWSNASTSIADKNRANRSSYENDCYSASEVNESNNDDDASVSSESSDIARAYLDLLLGGRDSIFFFNSGSTFTSKIVDNI
jgi:hypothetical protein